jgi:L-ascorbate metabolism protein UlaG (beta-lactamase superfamily)
MSLAFRWLGTAGIELRAADQVLALDPFFTRPSLRQMLRPITPDPAVVASHLLRCNFVLVTHPHYDHLLDVPAVLEQTGAVLTAQPTLASSCLPLGFRRPR